MVQDDGDNDLCTNGSYAEAMVMFTSTDVSAVEATAKLHRRQSGRSTKRRCWRPLHQGSMCPHNGDDSLHTGRSFANVAVLRSNIVGSLPSVMVRLSPSIAYCRGQNTAMMGGYELTMVGLNVVVEDDTESPSLILAN